MKRVSCVGMCPSAADPLHWVKQMLPDPVGQHSGCLSATVREPQFWGFVSQQAGIPHIPCSKGHMSRDSLDSSLLAGKTRVSPFAKTAA